MKTKITMNRTENKTFSEVFELFTKSRIAKGGSEKILKIYIRLQYLLRLLAVVSVGIFFLHKAALLFESAFSSIITQKNKR